MKRRESVWGDKSLFLFGTGQAWCGKKHTKRIQSSRYTLSGWFFHGELHQIKLAKTPFPSRYDLPIRYDLDSEKRPNQLNLEILIASGITSASVSTQGEAKTTPCSCNCHSRCPDTASTPVTCSCHTPWNIGSKKRTSESESGFFFGGVRWWTFHKE